MGNEKVTAKALKLVNDSGEIVDNDCLLGAERFGEVITGGWPMRGSYNGAIINRLRQVTSILGEESGVVVSL